MKQKKNKKIIEFRYYLIESIFPNLINESPILREENLNESQQELLNSVLRKFNIHFGTEYDLG